MDRSTTTPDDFLAAIDDAEVREAMVALDHVIAAAMPGRSRTLWQGVFWGGTHQSIIGYGDIVQPRPRGAHAEWFLVGLARQKSGFSVYVNAVEDGAYLGGRYADRLGKVKVGSASLGFRRVADIDLDVLAELSAHADRITPPDARRA